MSIDQKIETFFQPIADFVSGAVFYSVPLSSGLEVKLILVWLVCAALFFTFYMGFVNFRYFRHALDLIRGEYDADHKKKKKKASGEISRFQALTTSLSGTVGLGNIAGVAVAISVGGPGAMIWMILMGLFSMSTKFVEVTLGVKYRHHPNKEDRSQVYGGPMYYIRDGFKAKGWAQAGVIIAGIFAFACMCGAVGGGNMFQANQAYQQVLNVSGGAESFLFGKGWLFGLGLSALVGVVIIGGIKSIAAVTSRLVPIMGAIYMIAGIVVIVIHAANIPEALMMAFDSAFSLQAGFGGLLGGLLVGVQRAAFSNEAGLGSAAIVHCTARTDEPVTQGFVGMLGPFIDTVVICTVTALVIIISGAYTETSGLSGVELTSQAFASGISWFPYVLALTVFLFAYSTLITWSYYGTRAATYLFGEHHSVETVFKFFFLFCVVVGASVELSSLIAFSDAMILAMGIPNIIGLYLLAPEIKKDIEAYAKKQKKRKKV
jgi:AGCS family alanine or glycine:cation symporter